MLVSNFNALSPTLLARNTRSPIASRAFDRNLALCPSNDTLTRLVAPAGCSRSLNFANAKLAFAANRATARLWRARALRGRQERHGHSTVVDVLPAPRHIHQVCGFGRPLCGLDFAAQSQPAPQTGKPRALRARPRYARSPRASRSFDLDQGSASTSTHSPGLWLRPAALRP